MKNFSRLVLQGCLRHTGEELHLVNFVVAGPMRERLIWNPQQIQSGCTEDLLELGGKYGHQISTLDVHNGDTCSHKSLLVKSESHFRKELNPKPDGSKVEQPCPSSPPPPPPMQNENLVFKTCL